MATENLKTLIAIDRHLTLILEESNSLVCGAILSLIPTGLIIKIGTNSTSEVPFSEISKIKEGVND